MLRCLLALLVAAAMAAPAAPHSHKMKGLEIVHPWTPAQPEGVTAARVFMTIKNGSGKPDRLLSASAQRADKVELHDAGKGAAAFVVRNGQELDTPDNPRSTRHPGSRAEGEAIRDLGQRVGTLTRSRPMDFSGRRSRSARFAPAGMTGAAGAFKCSLG